ncbi:major facilitator superfamily MFS_1 [Gordonia bronchialis DSM 43247]|uniref:Major facilitator superfamily MFS_1 n=1 Tax=Gordonia bronchialis (strain ATCC 25592 / DSM 43247 / BCRC 13721 / JCM 3198 / KCTC 3076 / NBRC 16047 / NCTC 10667) TaxID=526226 RepID=D0L9A2_GORB4|nr:major facilitator superfamily MFS_1 [Gordonia bronchialis DSM 43247]STQ66977.1 2-acyl-glycerophospho-ethanolamine acyltransferase [Gordonia bronchialis]
MISSRSRHSRGWRIFVDSLRHSPGLGRLLAVRLSSQITDGIFQAALVGGILFNPERHADPLAVAGGLAVLLLPYSLIGPFAGALLDHWDRRNVLMYANLLRAAIIVLVATAIAAGAPDTVVLVGALAVTGASRFVAAGLSAGLPHVAHREVIVAINALFTTLGGAMLTVGLGVTLGLRAIFGDDNSGSAWTMASGVVMAIVAGGLAHRFAPLQLGPDQPDDPGRSAFHAVSVGLLHGARAVAHCRPAAAALSAIGAHRLVFGMNTLMILVIARHIGSGDGVDRLSLVVGFTGAGALVAAVLTPVVVARFGRRTTLIAALAVGACAELTVLSFDFAIICAAALVLGLIGQVAKLCGDVAMQVDIDDTVRGQVFSVQDAVFNIAYVGAVAIAALVIPPDGRATWLVVFGVLLYLAGIVVVAVLHRHRPVPAPAVAR